MWKIVTTALVTVVLVNLAQWVQAARYAVVLQTSELRERCERERTSADYAFCRGYVAATLEIMSGEQGLWGSRIYLPQKYTFESGPAPKVDVLFDAATAVVSKLLSATPNSTGVNAAVAKIAVVRALAFAFPGPC